METQDRFPNFPSQKDGRSSNRILGELKWIRNQCSCPSRGGNRNISLTSPSWASTKLPVLTRTFGSWRSEGVSLWRTLIYKMIYKLLYWSEDYPAEFCGLWPRNLSLEITFYIVFLSLGTWRLCRLQVPEFHKGSSRFQKKEEKIKKKGHFFLSCSKWLAFRYLTVWAS